MDIEGSSDNGLRTKRAKRMSPDDAMAQSRAQAHLYVLFSESGLVKIGRSGDPRKRRRGLEQNTGLRLYIVRIMKNEGRREKQVLHALRKYRLRGEWFTDSEEFRSAARRVLGVPLEFRWAPKVDPDYQNGMHQIFREMRIKDKSPQEIADYDDSDLAWGEYFRKEITLEELNVRWTKAGGLPLHASELRYGP